MEIRTPRELGFDPDRLAYVEQAIARDIEQGRYDGAALAVGRSGAIALLSVQGWGIANPVGASRRTRSSSLFRAASR